MSSKTWFNKSDLLLSAPIILDDLHGYVLPHASTKYTGHILSHTLRFKPNKIIKNIIIIYYPAFDKENIIIGTKKYYHEYYVPWQTMLVTLSFWKIDISSITFIPINVKETNKPIISLDNDNLLVILSSDFSHFLPFEEAIVKENTAAHALMYKNTDPKFMNNIVDDPRSYKYLFNILKKDLKKDLTLQWIGRTRSPGLKAVGYLSFLLMNQHKVKKNSVPDGIFVTCYDTEMRHRECLGNWFKNDSNKYSTTKEKELIDKVCRLGQSESRLTGGINIAPLVKYYTVSYLYKSQTNKFIRGWTTVLGNATYLSDVFLENTFNNGQWIDFDLDTEWPNNNNNNNFDMTETIEQLNLKAHVLQSSKSVLSFFNTCVKNVTINGNKTKRQTRKLSLRRNQSRNLT